MTESDQVHFIPNTAEEQKEMLHRVGVSDFEEIIANIPTEMREFDEEGLQAGISEYEALRELEKLTQMNTGVGNLSFLGGGSYDHFVPSAIGEIIGRSEYLTSYTPYQPEVSQGTLQAIFEYQSMICALTGMDVANASMYDGASALAEAGLLAVGNMRRSTLIVASTINPVYRQVVRTYCSGRSINIEETLFSNGGVDLEDLEKRLNEDTAAILVQSPNFFGCIERVEEMTEMAHDAGALMVMSADPISLGVLKKPGEMGVDVTVGEGQSLGSPPSYGGPYLGIFAAKRKLVREMPGRIVGQTWDVDERRGFVLTLQTREQHIRRERATSNICTNEGIVMLAATVYMALMGKQGMTKVAELCARKSHYLAEKIAQIPGYELMFDSPFFKEFVIRTPVSPAEIIDKMAKKGILAGVDISAPEYSLDNALLVCVTEKKSNDEMDRFVRLLADLSG